MTHGVYKVTGKRRYRGHATGAVFIARLGRHAERRAVERGDIEVLDRIEPDLEPGSYALPAQWERR